MRPLIGIMTHSLFPLPAYERGMTLDIDLLIFTPKGINWTKREIHGLLLEETSWQKTACPFPNTVYNRCYSIKDHLPKKLETILGKGTVFNHITRFDKWLVYKILWNSAVGHLIPNTYLYDISRLLRLLPNYKAMIIKPRKGSFGKQVYRVENTENQYRIYFKTNIPRVTSNQQDFTSEIKKLTHNNKFILQQFIQLERIDEHTYDLRLIVQKNRLGKWTIPGGCSRISLTDYYTTNSPLQIKDIDDLLTEDNSVTLDLISELNAVSIVIAEELERKLGHLGEISVDFGVDFQGMPWLIEVNGLPQKAMFSKLREDITKQIYLNPLEYAKYLSML